VSVLTPASTAGEIAGAVAAGRVTARSVIEAALARVAEGRPGRERLHGPYGERALRTADTIDAKIAAGQEVGPLAGVPFAVKNLFDIAGLPTRAGSKINRERAPAGRDGALVRKLEEAGAVLLGGLNMGEYAYDFTGENVHDGPSRNPHALTHMTGGSSGGSGAAVAAGLVPLTLGSDTNGSIRVPASFCGLFGLKPTFGRLSRAGSFPFVASFDHLGPLTRSVADLALSYDAMQGPDPDDPWSAGKAPDPVSIRIDAGASGLRIAVAGGYFARGGHPEAYRAVAVAAEALGATRQVEIPEAARARAAAYVITASEGAALHLDRIRTRPADFDPAVRDRLIAGAMIPAVWVHKAQRFRRWYRERVLALFDGST
jgi:aspartyl-tRNA(Asn)/glutamyl-tRNA(Gln) amidotransferase subunit A